MKKRTSLLLLVALATSLLTTEAMADIKRGQIFYQKRLKVCKEDGIRNGAVFAAKHSRKEWASLKESGKLQDEWKHICPHGESKIDKMRKKDIKNLYSFVWKYASDGDIPSCGSAFFSIEK